jgi:Fe-S cluster biosynthesis and repair protein YggX
MAEKQEKRGRGRPKKPIPIPYSDWQKRLKTPFYPDELDKQLQEYIDSISFMELKTDKDGNPIKNMNGEDIYIRKFVEQPSALGARVKLKISREIWDRMANNDYVKDKMTENDISIAEANAAVISKYKSIFEKYLVDKTISNQGAVGAMFQLKAIYQYNDKPENASAKPVTINLLGGSELEKWAK